MYRVEFKKSARKEFEKLPASIQQRVVEASKLLAINPFSELLHIKKLSGAPSLYRVRIGEYRLVYELQKDKLIVLVIKIGHRREVYRAL